MEEFFQVIEDPRPCSYLPDATAQLKYRFIGDITPVEHADLLARGYRRFGMHFFYPACPHCDACRSMRILVRQHSPSTSERRILRKNEHIRAELHPLFVRSDIIALYNLYHHFMRQHRGWPTDRISPAKYHQSFVAGPSYLGRQWLYYDGNKLIGVALMDEVPDAISLVYAFFDPNYRGQSLGTFSILNQLRYAQSKDLSYAYLGYWVEQCQSLSYKSRFQPREILREYPAPGEPPVWE